MPMKPVASIAAVLACLALGSVARADFVITVNDAMIAQGSQGFVDVTITSTNPAGSPVPDNIASFSALFQISPIASGGRLMDLIPINQIDLFPPNYTGGLPYVLGTDMFFANGNPGGPPDPSQMLPGAADDGGFGDVNMQVPVGGALLVRLLLRPEGGSLTPLQGDTFSISLVPSSGQGSFIDNTNFADADLNTTPFTSVSGTVTIGPRAVPEPSATAMACGIFLVCAGLGARRSVGRRSR
jgi:hypothetical protein